MDGGIMTNGNTGTSANTGTRANTKNLFWEDPILDESVHLLREHRAEMAVWLALEVLQGDRVALDDRELVSRLGACQERLEERLRAKIAARQEGGQVISGEEPVTAGPVDHS
jgi:hypothetical protein